MSRLTINIGAAEGDGTGDHARVGGNKINLNFAELYAFLGGDALPIPAAGRIIFSDGIEINSDANLSWDATTGLLAGRPISSPIPGQTRSERFGSGSGSSGSNTGCSDNLAVGRNTKGSTTSFSNQNVAVGGGASCTGSIGVAIGESATAANAAVAIGQGVAAIAGGIVIGFLANQSAGQFVLGAVGSCGHADAGVLGGSGSTRTGDLFWGNSQTTALAPGFCLQGTTDAFTSRDIARFFSEWIDVTDATRKGRAKFSVFDTAEREFMRADANGTANPLVTFFGDIQWGVANVALGGGAVPTLGTIGGTGPAAAAQRGWMRVIETDGVASFIPTWR